MFGKLIWSQLHMLWYFCCLKNVICEKVIVCGTDKLSSGLMNMRM